jgi:hypothetical protein
LGLNHENIINYEGWELEVGKIFSIFLNSIEDKLPSNVSHPIGFETY